MKRFLLKLVLLLALVAGLDALCGFFFQRLTKSAIGGDTARNEYIANKVTAPVLFFGSSRAIHHYDPQIFKDSLEVDCYNCGQNGMGIILFYGRYMMITQRYIPKLIIYDVLAGFDVEKNDNHSYLTWLKPYYHKAGIDSIFWKIEHKEHYKMVSQMYRYNGKILQILTDNFKIIRVDYNGYRPCKGVMNYEVKEEKESPAVKVDCTKMYFMEKFIQDCKHNGTQLVFTLSPFYGGNKHLHQTYAAIYELAKKYNIQIISHCNDEDIIYRNELFSDSYHMNHIGAEIYSRRLAHEIKGMYKRIQMHESPNY